MYMNQTKTERQSHIDLNERCVNVADDVNPRTQRSHVRAALSKFMGTGPIKGAHAAHACHNPRCSNMKHVYWGTPKENMEDAIENGIEFNSSPRAVEVTFNNGKVVEFESVASILRHVEKNVKDKVECLRYALKSGNPCPQYGIASIVDA